MAAADSNQHGDDAKRQPSIIRRLLRKTVVRIGLGIVALLFVGGGVLWWLNARQYKVTDDAFIATHMVYVAPQIAGRLTKIYVSDNQMVRAGAPLVDIDAAPFRAQYEQAVAKEGLAQTALAQARAKLRSAKAQAATATRTLARYRAIRRRSPDAVSPEHLDQLAAQKQAAVAQERVAKEAIAGAHAQIALDKAAVTVARINLGYTRIVAPEAGHVTQRNIAVGNYVTPGEEMMAIVPTKLWIIANYKETELTHMRKGQPATATIDACGGALVKGHVNSIQHGAGQAFQILPPQNATGNFVKVVQRVPVKIVIDHLPAHCTLGPGMSVEASVKVR